MSSVGRRGSEEERIASDAEIIANSLKMQGQGFLLGAGGNIHNRNMRRLKGATIPLEVKSETEGVESLYFFAFVVVGIAVVFFSKV